MSIRNLGLWTILAVLGASACSASNDKSSTAGDTTGAAGNDAVGTGGDGSGTTTSGSSGSTGAGGSTGTGGVASGTGGTPGTAGSPVMGSGGTAMGTAGTASMGTCNAAPMAPPANAPACKTVFLASAPMIDDMEIRPPENDGPHGDTDNGMPGHWFVAGDGKEGTWIPPADKWVGFYNVTLAPPRDASLQAMFFGGQGFTSWGVALGVGVAACVDASPYMGVTFWAKSTSGAALPVKFDIGTYDVVVSTNGGGCTGACAGKYETSVTIPVDWTEFTIPFCSFAPTGTTIPLAKNKIVNMTYLIPGNVTYQFYIDDISFY